MEERIIRIEDYTNLKKLHEKIVSLINQHNVTCYHAIGILETIKQEIFMANEEEV